MANLIWLVILIMSSLELGHYAAKIGLIDYEVIGIQRRA